MNNYNNGITFTGASPVMTGTWFNPQTGDRFTVKDTFFENNEYVVYTTDGRMLNYNQIQYYVQSEGKNDMDSNNNVHDDLPSEVQAILEPLNNGSIMENSDLIGGSLWENSTRNAAVVDSYFIPESDFRPQIQFSNNTHIIEKALSKTTLPEININLQWKKYPEKEIEMLKDIMDIPMQEIVDWYISKMGATEIRNLMIDSINSYFNVGESQNETKEIEHETPNVKKTKSKTKK